MSAVELEGRLRLVQEVTREAAADLRARALAIDTDPDDMAPHLGSPAYALIRRVGLPARFREPGSDAELLASGCLENAVGTLELARGDAGAALACPAPSLAGVVVDLLGSPEQKDRFFGRLADGRGWGFFAMTEPGHGSDATALESRLEKAGPGEWRLHGMKKFIGNGARGQIGVVFARTGPSVLSIRAVLVELPTPGWSARRLDSVGLLGAGVSELHFDGVPVHEDQLLGNHLPVTRRGIWGAVQVFTRMRIQVAAAAVGTALAICEYVDQHCAHASDTELMTAEALAARDLVFQAAARVDRLPESGYLSSVAKMTATRTGIRVAHWAAAVAGPAGLLEHPLLEKWIRDIHAFEFMEGTSHIQRLQTVRGYQTGDVDA